MSVLKWNKLHMFVQSYLMTHSMKLTKELWKQHDSIKFFIQLDCHNCTSALSNTNMFPGLYRLRDDNTM